jgi:hypothetical protein
MKNIITRILILSCLLILGISDLAAKEPDEKTPKVKEKAKKSNVLSITPSCNPVATFSENFDGVTFPSLPPCWDKIIRNNAHPDSSIAVSPYGATSSPNTVNLYGASSFSTADVILVSPNVNTLSAGTYRLKFKANANVMVQIGTLSTNLATTAVFNMIQEIAPNDNGPSTEFIINFNTYSGSDSYIGIRLKTGSTETSSQYAALDNVVWENTLTNEQFDLSQMNYYPNPVKDILNISNSSTISAVTVYNLLGQKVEIKTINETLTKIDMSALPKGTYLVSVTSDNVVKTIKINKK